jgi:ribosomal protein S27AE
MLTLVMPYMLVKDVPLELVAEVNRAAKLAGKNQSEWVRWVLEAQFNGTGLRRTVDERVVGSSLASCSESLAPAEGDEVEEDEKRCPECGEPLVWNKVMKHWECECGWHGKKEGKWLIRS